MAIRKCDYCDESYHVYDKDAGTFLEHFCSEYCEEKMEDAIDNMYRK